MPRLLLLISLLFPINSFAQTAKNCELIREKADAAIVAQDYPLALTKLRAYKICDPSKVTQADNKIAEVFNKIKAQRDSAIIARNQARVEKARAEEAQRNAEHQAYLAQLSALSSNVALLNNENPTLAFRLACLAYENNPSPENAAILNSITSDTTNGMFFLKHGYFADVAYDDQKNILYGISHQSIDEYNRQGRQIRTFPYTTSQQFVATSANARYTVTVMKDTISLFRHADYAKKQITWPIPNIFAARWSRDGNYILLSANGKLCVLDTLLHEVYKLTDKYISAFDVSPGMDAVAVAHGNEVIIYDPAEQAPIDTIPEPTVRCLAFSGDGSKLYTSRLEDKVIKQWDADSNVPLFIFEGHAGKVLSMNFMPGFAGKDTILSTSEDGVSILWTGEGRIVRTLKHKNDQVISSTLSAGGKTVLTRTNKGTMLWDLRINPLGVVSRKTYQNNSVVDIAANMFVLGGFNNKYTIVTPDTVSEISLPDVIYNVVIVDEGNRFLLTGANNISILNLNTGERKVLVEGSFIHTNASVNADGKILCWNDKTLYYFNREGLLLKKKEFPYFIQSACIRPGTDDLLYINSGEARLDNILTGKQIAKWRRNEQDREYFRGMQYAPYGNYILCWTGTKAFLFDTEWYLLKTYEHDYLTKAKFSETGDSLYLLGHGAEVRYTLNGLKRSDYIYKLTIADKLKYNVPGLIKDIVSVGDWTELEACIAYFYIDYFNSRSELNIEQLKYLEARSHQFYQKSRGYYSMLDTRIGQIRSYAASAGNSNFRELEKVLLKIAANLQKEKKTLAAIYK